LSCIVKKVFFPVWILSQIGRQRWAASARFEARHYQKT